MAVSEQEPSGQSDQHEVFNREHPPRTMEQVIELVKAKFADTVKVRRINKSTNWEVFTPIADGKDYDAAVLQSYVATFLHEHGVSFSHTTRTVIEKRGKRKNPVAVGYAFDVWVLPAPEK